VGNIGGGPKETQAYIGKNHWREERPGKKRDDFEGGNKNGQPASGRKEEAKGWSKKSVQRPGLHLGTQS